MSTDNSGPVRAPACFSTSMSLATTGPNTARHNNTPPSNRGALFKVQRSSSGHGSQYTPSGLPRVRHCWSSQLGYCGGFMPLLQHSLQPRPPLPIGVVAPRQQTSPTTASQTSRPDSRCVCRKSVGLVGRVFWTPFLFGSSTAAMKHASGLRFGSSI